MSRIPRLIGPEFRRVQNHFRAEAPLIAKAYVEGIRLEAELAQNNGTNWIGGRKLTRKAMPPRDRPLNVLKRGIYRLAWEIDDLNGLRALIKHVKGREEKWGIVHRPRQSSVVDWTVRLVRACLAGSPSAQGIRKPEFLFNTVAMSRISIELNFAFHFCIHPDFVTMFVDEMGGHEVISAVKAVGGYNLRNETWWRPLERKRRVFEVHSPMPHVEPDEEDEDTAWVETSNILLVSEHDDDDWN